MTFEQGMIVEYKGMIGKVNFIGSTYITITIGNSEEPLRNVDVLIPPSEYDKIKIH
jgi:hypothetical protein